MTEQLNKAVERLIRSFDGTQKVLRQLLEAQEEMVTEMRRMGEILDRIDPGEPEADPDPLASRELPQTRDAEENPLGHDEEQWPAIGEAPPP